jgi:hypothetical protein
MPRRSPRIYEKLVATSSTTQTHLEAHEINELVGNQTLVLI